MDRSEREGAADGFRAPRPGSVRRRSGGPPRTDLFAGAARLLLAVSVLLAWPPFVATASGQQRSRPCGDARKPFPAPLGSPLEPRTRLAPVHVDRGDRERWVALVDLGERIPFWIRRPCPPAPDAAGPGGSPSPVRAAEPPAPRRARVGIPAPPEREPSDPAGLELAGAVAGGVFSRFDLEGNGNEFIEAHYRAGFRLRARLRGVESRLELYHVSSHLGDEFLERTGRTPISTSREGVELLVRAAPGGDVSVYGGPGVLLRSTRGLEPLSFRAGVEWRGRPAGPGGFAPYVSAESFWWDELGTPMTTGEAGVRAVDGRVRLALLAGAGPSRAEQFFPDDDETLWGLSFSVTW